ncbi:MAG TPA: TonB-dependent receptor [Bacteroidaceae bacterium]|nr:TonB-dependent receptor [Bacteroidaceae bacterium]
MAKSEKVSFNENSTEQYLLDDVVVTGTRMISAASAVPMAITIVDKNTLLDRYESSLMNILNEHVAGVFVTQRALTGYGISTGSAGGINIRGVGGTNSAQVLVLIDGHPQYAGLMGHPIADSYQTPYVQRVEVVRGPASTIYGSNAMGGVINIITERPQEDATSGRGRVLYGSFNTLESSISYRFKRGLFSGDASLLYNKTDGHRDNMLFDQKQGFIKLGYELSANVLISADANITNFKSQNPGALLDSLLDNQADITRGSASLTVDNEFERTKGAITYFINWGDHSINDGHKMGEAPLTYTFHSTDILSGINAFQNSNLFTGNITTVGFDYFHIEGQSWFKHDDGTISAPWNKALPKVEKSADEFGVYIDLRQRVLNNLSLSAGIRLDYHTITGKEWIPQIGAAYTLLNENEFKFMIGKGFRNPTFKDLYMFGSQNPDLLPESLINYELSYSRKFIDGRLNFDINLFYIDGENIIQTLLVNGRRLNVNTGRIKNRGVESSLFYIVNKDLRFKANYSYLNMSNPIVAAPGNMAYLEADWRHNALRICSGIRYVSDLYTSVVPGDVSKESFLLLNLRATYRVNAKCSFFVRGENLLSQEYEINKGFNMPKASIAGGIDILF